MEGKSRAAGLDGGKQGGSQHFASGSVHEAASTPRLLQKARPQRQGLGGAIWSPHIRVFAMRPLQSPHSQRHP